MASKKNKPARKDSNISPSQEVINKDVSHQISENDVIFLTPTREALEIIGKVAYHEGSQAWNTFRLKKALIDEFPHLKEKQGKFLYKMVYHRDFKDLKKYILNMEKNNELVIPIMFFLCKEK